MSDKTVKFLDCTLRDGGYYNNWDFPLPVIKEYLKAMQSAGVDIVELGLRSLKNDCFKGACAFTTDDFIKSLEVPQGLKVSVMINASEIVNDDECWETVLEKLFPEPATFSPVSVVRVACHVGEFEKALPASQWLKNRGFIVGYNLMQVADRSKEEIERLARIATQWPLDVLYFADSLGSMSPDNVTTIVRTIRLHWSGELGIHTHDNMGLALQNSMRAMDENVTWVDSTVTGMGRGPGNAKTEYIALEIADRRKRQLTLVPLMTVIKNYFAPMQYECGWGSNTYYYLAGKYGIHPTYIQEMLGDTRYSEEDVLAVIEHLRSVGGNKFNTSNLDEARKFYLGSPRGKWDPKTALDGREVLIIGSGPSVAVHRLAIESYIRRANPYVLALNTHSHISECYITARVACHPVRLLSDCELYNDLAHPLITPVSMLPEEITTSLAHVNVFDYGLGIKENVFEVHECFAILPNPLVAGYALAIAASGNAVSIKLAGFDGYGAGDCRTMEMQYLLDMIRNHMPQVNLSSVTPTTYEMPVQSIYAL
ncbi:aldolase catalytic domain-containing protein [Pseudomonas urmiensis]|uniref:aldolase catalytic domain-containing protein n=1 Tax=Pseudomonas urmiensis TaxID=2745493 RepID=UPI003D09E2EF